MYYDIATFLQFVIALTGCIVNAMDLKNFSQHYSVIKKGPFQRIFKSE